MEERIGNGTILFSIAQRRFHQTCARSKRVLPRASIRTTASYCPSINKGPRSSLDLVPPLIFPFPARREGPPGCFLGDQRGERLCERRDRSALRESSR